jgi:hypothetical protein
MSGRIAAIAGAQEKGRQGHAVRRRGIRRRVEIAGRRHELQARVRSRARAIDRRHRARSDNPKVVWVGTGESWTRNSVSIGDGIYKSTDGGETWTNMGLPNSERITRIVVDPRDGNTVYACVPGKLWSDSADRGLYKTTDGGQTWSLILKGGNLSTGCSSVTLNPKIPTKSWPACGTSGARAGRSAPAATVRPRRRRAACFIRPMAVQTGPR